jgi:hypothetical protein
MALGPVKRTGAGLRAKHCEALRRGLRMQKIVSVSSQKKFVIKFDDFDFPTQMTSDKYSRPGVCVSALFEFDGP